MTEDEQASRAEQLFHAAREIPEEGRAAFLDRECGDDAELRREVEELLAIVRSSFPLADSTEPDGPAGGAADDPPRIPGYRILDALGQGGMGTVYLAEQKEPVRRRVALKVVKLGMDSKAVLARFELERQALAVMNHDNIARVYDAGTTPRGQPFFVMEHCPGLPMTQYCDRQRLSLEDRLKLFQHVCEGVQHAHQKGVIHRDLKPGNVLVTEEQGRPVPKIIDFGIARATDHMLLVQTMFTERGQIVGTPAYMSPEQADPTVADVDTRTDVYALGVMLYELLIGALPFSPQELQGRGLVEMQRVIREVEPPRPSTRLATLGEQTTDTAHRRRTSPGALTRAVRNDLDWVVLKAMEKDRNRRYDSASELAADLQRYLDHEPVVAGPPSAAYRIKKLLRRHRTQVAFAGAVFLALLAGAIGTLLQWHRAEKALTEFRLLSFVEKHQSLQASQVALYPARTPKVPALRAWLQAAQELVDAIPEVRAAVPALAARKDTWTDDEKLLHDTLSELLQDLEAFTDEKGGTLRSVRNRLGWAESVKQRTVDDYASAWSETRKRIAASERYGGFDLVPQTGLVPLGQNPGSGLFEFLHLRSHAHGAPIPEWRPGTSKIEVTDATGIVFVLLPPGRFFMGSQNRDPNAPNYDRNAPDSSTITARDMPAFFISKFEVTQAQWYRLTDGKTPSYYQPGRRQGDHVTGWTHPVESVPWSSCVTWMQRHLLDMPTEAQWEYAARGRSAGPWSTGVERDTLIGAANIVCASAKRAAPDIGWNFGDWPEFDDGWVVHAPVDRFRPNDFGLYCVHGNVAERCYSDAEGGVVTKGGCFYDTAGDSRLANRVFDSLTAMSHIGVRSVRRVDR